MAINFLVTIDTEEEREWGSNYEDHTHYTVENIKFLKPLQDLFDRHGVKATYLIDYPVAMDKQAATILRDFRENHNAEIGAHLHPWVNPPYEEERTVANSFPANLPEELQHKKLQVLTAAINENIHLAPQTYRAGRYGFNESSIAVLEDLGYKVDSSVVPFRRAKRDYEPDFGFMPSIEPYRMSYKNILRRGTTKLLQVPLTVGFSKKVPSILARHYIDLPNIGLRRLLKLGLGVDLHWLRPSYSNLEEMIALSETIITGGGTILNMMFHSNELMPAGSKYCKTEQDVKQYLERLDHYFTYLNNNFTIDYIRLKDTYPIYSDS